MFEEMVYVAKIGNVRVFRHLGAHFLPHKLTVFLYFSGVPAFSKFIQSRLLQK